VNQGLAACINHMTKKEIMKKYSPVDVFSLKEFVEKKVESETNQYFEYRCGML